MNSCHNDTRIPPNSYPRNRHAKWFEQVHLARWEFSLQCVASRTDLRVVEDFFRGIGEVGALRLTLAYLPVFHALGDLERHFHAVALQAGGKDGHHI